MAIIAIKNSKGGVGKTTTAINLADQSRHLGKTLLVDCDKQSNTTKQFIEGEPKQTIRNLFEEKEVTPIEVRENLYLIPSSLEQMTGIDLDIQNEYSREFFLKKAMKRYVKEFDYIFMDCPPEIGLVSVNALVAAEYVILPIKAALFSMEGIEGMIQFISNIRQKLNPDLFILGILITHFDGRLIISANILEDLRKKGWDGDVFKTVIRFNTSIANAQFNKKTIFEYDRRSHGANDYAKLGQEVHRKIKEHQNKSL